MRNIRYWMLAMLLAANVVAAGDEDSNDSSNDKDTLSVQERMQQKLNGKIGSQMAGPSIDIDRDVDMPRPMNSWLPRLKLPQPASSLTRRKKKQQKARTRRPTEAMPRKKNP